MDWWWLWLSDGDVGVYYILVSGFVCDLQFLEVPPGVRGGPGCWWETGRRIATPFLDQD